MHGYVPLNRVRGWGISCLKQIEQRNEQFYRALVAYSLINPVNLPLPLYFYTVHKNIRKSPIFLFFKLLMHSLVYQPHSTRMERQKNWGKGGLALEMTRGFDMRVCKVNNRNYYHSDSSCYNIMLSMNMLQYKQHAKGKQCPIAKGQWILLLGY